MTPENSRRLILQGFRAVRNPPNRGNLQENVREKRRVRRCAADAMCLTRSA